MSSLSNVVGTVFQATNVSEISLAVDTSSYDTTGTATVSGDGFASDADDGYEDSQTVTGYDPTPGNSPLGTLQVVDTAPGQSPSPATTYDVVAVNGGMILLGLPPVFDDGTQRVWSQYALLSNTSLENEPASSFPLTFSNTDPNAYSPPCFVAGTRIATPAGDVAVEDLRVGDLVLTVSGEAMPVTWVGRRRVDIARHPDPASVRPVRIEAGAFEDDVPRRDLMVSPDHNLYLDGVLIPAKCLVDGVLVRQVDQTVVSYHHFELERHAIVLAENAPAETYLDVGNRHAFEGGAVVTAFPDFASGPDLNHFIWDAEGAAPLVLVGPQIERVRARLAARAAARVDLPSRRRRSA